MSIQTLSMEVGGKFKSNKTVPLRNYSKLKISQKKKNNNNLRLPWENYILKIITKDYVLGIRCERKYMVCRHAIHRGR